MINVNVGGLIDVSTASIQKKQRDKSRVARYGHKYVRRSVTATFISEIHEPSCLQCKRKISVAGANVDSCGICYCEILLCEDGITNEMIYFCPHCSKHICSNCRHKQYLHNILHYYENKKITMKLAYKLFCDWYEQNKQNTNLMIQLVEHKKIFDFACQSPISGKLFQIWCNSNETGGIRSTVLDKLLCPATFEISFDHNDVDLLDVLDKNGFDFKTNIDKKYEMNKWTPFVRVCSQGGGFYSVKFLRKLFEISRKHNAKIDIFTKDERNRTALDNAILFGTVEVVEYLLSDVYSRSKQSIIDILTTSASVEGGTPDMNINRADTVSSILFLCCRQTCGLSGTRRNTPSERNTRFEIFKILVQYIRKYNLNCFYSYDRNGWNIIHRLCANNWVSYLKVLHDTFGDSIDWNTRTNSRWKGTPLMVAIGALKSNFNIECIRFLTSIESIDIVSDRCEPKFWELEENHRLTEQTYIAAPSMTSLEYSCFFGCKIEVVRLLFQTWIKRLKSIKNNESNQDNKPTTLNSKLIERLIEITKQGKQDRIGIKKGKKSYNTENYEKIEALLKRIKYKLEDNSNDYHTISSLVNYIPRDITTNKKSNMVNDYANVDAKWDTNYNNMLKSRFKSNLNHKMPEAMEKKLKELRDSDCKKNEDWYILKHLGTGAFGRVDLAIHETLGKRAALKQVKIKNVDENTKEKSINAQSTKKQGYVNSSVTMFLN